MPLPRGNKGAPRTRRVPLRARLSSGSVCGSSIVAESAAVVGRGKSQDLLLTCHVAATLDEGSVCGARSHARESHCAPKLSAEGR